jgi:hypothetical protein
MYAIFSEVNQVERCQHLAKVFEAALSRVHAGAEVKHAQLSGIGNLLRFETLIAGLPPFALEFDWTDSQQTGQSDEGWAKVFMAEVEKYLG